MTITSLRPPVPFDLGWVESMNPNDRILRGPTYAMAKRVMDMLVVIVTLPLWLPLLGLSALLLKLESPRDPVLFVQMRPGRGGRLFRLLKFRTMITGAPEMKEKLTGGNGRYWQDQKIEGDPRVTRVGRWLRRSSLDELPQLVNILRGEMSMVGPRPTVATAESYKLWQTERFNVLPGLTGLWQVCARGKTSFDERQRLDILYVKHRCLRLDLQILIRTVPAVLSGRGAY